MLDGIECEVTQFTARHYILEYAYIPVGVGNASSTRSPPVESVRSPAWAADSLEGVGIEGTLREIRPSSIRIALFQVRFLVVTCVIWTLISHFVFSLSL